MRHLAAIRRLLLLGGLMATASGVAAQGASPAAPTCNCQVDLDSIAVKLERNYIAFHLEILGTPREADYRALVARLHQRAATTSEADCIFLLRELTDWFHDGHLFVAQWPTLSPEQASRLAEATPVIAMSEREVRASLDRRKGRLDPIEGIWYWRGFRVGIIPRAGPGEPDFVAVVLQSDSANWRPGQVRARFWKNPNGTYRTIATADDHSRRDAVATIYRHLLLAFPPVTWGRAYPLAPYEVGMLDPVDPERPTARVAGREAVVISVPSHDPQYRPYLDSLVAAHRAEIVAHPFLIVDIRGDLGGSSQTTAALVPFLVTRDKRPAIGPVGTSMVLSSPGNIAYFEQGGWNPDSVAQRMKAAPGQVLPLIRENTLDMPFPNDTLLPLPRRVAVLMDRGVASAGEAFLLQARKSTKVTLIGNNSAGMIDYQSVRLVGTSCPAQGNLLGFPMIAASETLPKDGLNQLGIPPDVRPGTGTADQVAWAIRYLASLKP